MDEYAKDSLFEKGYQSQFVDVEDLKIRSGIIFLNESEIPNLEKEGIVMKEGPFLGPDDKSSEYRIHDPNAKPGERVVGTFRPEIDEGGYRGHKYHSGK